jgi:peptide deformylase
MAQFTEQEIALINSIDETPSMRVLLIEKTEDSLVLRKKCSDIDVSKNKKELALLIERMKATMEAESGVGIAAPQVGISKNIFLFTRLDQPDFPVVAAINPKIINHPEETICFENDGCLSIPGVAGNSIRYPWIEVEYTNEKGELIKEKQEGYSRSGNFTGIIFQHEYDHLQGILFTDKLCPINNTFSE